ncbi:Ligand-Gated ion Channel [Trichostrongylus colubriformis]|uniref:Ligand-Gated ion Channel n=1 Tax=Trichostrongylus colubriformis TaxID=6319 RepID=A0AAN8FQN5_TRICO
MQFVFLNVLLLLDSCLSAERLTILTTYEAEDAGLIPSVHPQCRAWMLWWKTQHTVVDLTADDFDLLAYRRQWVLIDNERDAIKYHVPLAILKNFTEVDINFENVCRFHPRELKIASKNAAKKYRIITEKLCLLSRIQKEANSDESQGEIKIDSAGEDTKNEIVIHLKDTKSNAEGQYGLDDGLFENHKSIAIYVSKICDGATVADEPEDLQYFEEKYGTSSFNISLLDASIEDLMKPMQNPNLLDGILRRFQSNDIASQRPFPSTRLIPFLKRVKYDSRIPPVLFAGDKVVVKIGLQIQAMSNFELSTMDYDLDTWLRMAWYDPRLRHGSSRPILVNELTFLKKIWRPDPIFTNAKSATFQKVTFLNFYMFIFPDGEVFLDFRVYLKPTAAEIVLCKYPHDNPACSLKISSLGFTSDAVEFEWFSDPTDAIQLNRDLEIPELSLINVKAETCDGSRKSGNYSCMVARFFLHRQLGFHLAQTYIPTAICVVFSWISVWLPEEFVEGRIFVSLTVFLTLSAESNSAKEELPKVSYIKAIDIWFGFTSVFVFVTMIQALAVITFEHHSKSIRRKCEDNIDNYSKYEIMQLMLRSRYYHRVARKFDEFCKVMYPVTFVLFLMIYAFVIIQGDEDKCLRQ